MLFITYIYAQWQQHWTQRTDVNTAKVEEPFTIWAETTFGKCQYHNTEDREMAVSECKSPISIVMEFLNSSRIGETHQRAWGFW